MSQQANQLKGIAKAQSDHDGRTHVWILDDGATEPHYLGPTSMSVTIGAAIAGYRVVFPREFNMLLRTNRATLRAKARAVGMRN